MHQLKIGTIPLPKIYICDSGESRECRRLGVPYIIKPKEWDDLKVVKAVLWRTLYKKFPHLRWNEILGMDDRAASRIKVNVPTVVEDEPQDEPWEPKPGTYREVEAKHRVNPQVDEVGMTDESMEFTENAEYRTTEGGFDEDDTVDWTPSSHVEWNRVSIDSYIGDLGHYVDVEELQQLRLLPTFLGDIANAIKMNLMNAAWCDGYNKKLGCNVGRWQGTDQAPNLIILDVSGSIPSGVAGTMVSLIETLRHQANADLIITSRRSEYWAANEDLPNADKLSYLIGGCNECTQFYGILRKHVLGKHWGNVIVFGDQDSPLRGDIQRHAERFKGGADNIRLDELQSTRIDRIMAFHTCSRKVPGYGLWAVDADSKAEVVYNTDWVKSMRDGW